MTRGTHSAGRLTRTPAMEKGHRYLCPSCGLQHQSPKGYCLACRPYMGFSREALLERLIWLDTERQAVQSALARKAAKETKEKPLTGSPF